MPRQILMQLLLQPIRKFQHGLALLALAATYSVLQYEASNYESISLAGIAIWKAFQAEIIAILKQKLRAAMSCGISSYFQKYFLPLFKILAYNILRIKFHKFHSSAVWLVNRECATLLKVFFTDTVHEHSRI